MAKVRNTTLGSIRTTVYVPAVLWKRIRLQSIETGVSTSTLIRRLLEAHLKRTAKTNRGG